MSLRYPSLRLHGSSSLSVIRTFKRLVSGQIRCFGALFIILREALFFILKRSPATSENDPSDDPKSGRDCVLKQAAETEYMRRK